MIQFDFRKYGSDIKMRLRIANGTIFIRKIFLLNWRLVAIQISGTRKSETRFEDVDANYKSFWFWPFANYLYGTPCIKIIF